MNQKLKQASLKYFILPLWIGFAIILSLKRSLWSDEIFRWSQSQMNLLDGIKSLWSEPSPFTPGEIVLNYVCDHLFGRLLPLELWTRLPGILFGAGTLWVTTQIAEFNPKARYLSLFTAMSVAFSMLSLQMRPYASLIFTGSVCVWILLQTQSKVSKPLENLSIAIILFFGHIYGVCYASFALLLRRRWVLTGIGALAVALPLYFVKISPIHDTDPLPTWRFFISTIFFVVGNPGIALYCYLPLFLIGTFSGVSKKENRRIFLIFLISTLGPSLVIVITNYYFSARQLVGGIVPFLYFCSLGLTRIEEFLTRFQKKQIIAKMVIAFLIFVAAIFPWLNCFVGNQQRPLVDQPIHLFKEVAKTISTNHYRHIFITNPCQLDAILFYLSHQKISHSQILPELTVANVSLCRITFEDLTLDTPTQAEFCKTNSGSINNSNTLLSIKEVLDLSPNYDVIVYDQVSLEGIVSQIPRIRTW